MEIVDKSHTNCIILTNTIPIRPYKIREGYMLRAVEASNQMFQGFSYGVPHGQSAVMAFPYYDESSYNIYRDLIIFHSFICDDSAVYRYAEHIFANHKSYEDRELIFLDFCPDNSADNTQSIRLIDFDQFPITLWGPKDEKMKESENHDADSNSDDPLFSEPDTGDRKEYDVDDDDIDADLLKNFRFGMPTPLLEVEVSYTKAFNLFREFKRNTRRLYNQIGLYVFTRSIGNLSEMYRNDYASIALYIAILESIARPGKPNEVSWEQWLTDKFGKSFNSLRKIRHKFIHGVDREDITDTISELYDKEEDIGWLPDDFEKEKRLFDIKKEVENLEIIIRNTLTQIFLKQYEQSL